MAAVATQDSVDVLVKEMGFARGEAMMAIADCNGNIELAVENLLTGKYAPPPYSDIENERSTILNCDDVAISLAPGNRPQMVGSKKISHENYFGIDANPPPYTKVCLKSELDNWEVQSKATFCSLDSSYSRVGGGSFARCSTCFDEIFEKEKSGLSNKAVKDGFRNYHYDCYMKSRGPKCSHCCFPLSKPDLDRDLSGNFLIYNGNKYHVECYEKYAGPRCSYCFNVIIEKPTEEFTGQWIGECNKMFHEECFYRKKYSEERARYT